MLNNQHRISQIAQMRERFKQPVVIARVQADGRFIQHVKNTAQLRSDLRRQPDTLRLAAGKRDRRTIQAQVIQTDCQQEFQAVLNLFPNTARDLLFAFR